MDGHRIDHGHHLRYGRVLNCVSPCLKVRPSSPPPSLFRLQFKDLNRFGKNQLTVHSLLGDIADHAVSGKQFGKLLEGTGASVADVVVAVIAEGDGIFGYILGSMYAVSENTIRLIRLIGRLPDIGTVIVLELTDLCNRLVIHDKRSVLTVRTLQSIYKRKDVIGFHSRRKRTGKLTAACFGKQTEGLAYTGAVEESVLFSIGESLAELFDDIAFQVEGIVIEQFLESCASIADMDSMRSISAP